MNNKSEERNIAEAVLSGMLQQLQFDPQLTKRLPAILVEMKGVLEEVIAQFDVQSVNKEDVEKQKERDQQILQEREKALKEKEKNYVETIEDGIVIVDKRGRR